MSAQSLHSFHLYLAKMRPAFHASVLFVRRNILKVTVDLRGVVKSENERPTTIKFRLAQVVPKPRESSIS